MLKKYTSLLITTVLLVNVFVQDISAIELPNVLDFVSDVASDAADMAGQAGEVITDVAAQAGDGVSDVASQVGDFASDVAGQIGDTVSNALSMAGDLTAGFAEQAGKVAEDWGKKAGETTDAIKEALGEAGKVITVKASELGDATVEKASEYMDNIGNAAAEAIDTVSGAGNMVIDKAGHVIDLASAGAGYVTSAAGTAFEVLQEKGALLMQIAEDAVADIDLSDKNNWTTARKAVDTAIETAYEQGLLNREKINEEAVHIITSVVFGTMMYGYQYSNGQITLGEYASSMSEILIREGMPSGVGFVVDLLPINIPNAGNYAKELTYYILTFAYDDVSGDEVQTEEEELIEAAGI